ncbi:MAG: hypothetical protein ABL955_09815, partial [Elusimicrobiota bacterium]
VKTAAPLAKEGVTASWGVAQLPKTGDASEFVRAADAAMFKMKAGKSGVRRRGTDLARAYKDQGSRGSRRV